MKLAKRLLVLVAAMTMVLGLVACGGEKYPQTYNMVQDPSEARKQEGTLTLNEDSTFEYVFISYDSKDDTRVVMECKATGTYTKEDKVVKVEVTAVECNAMNGDTPVNLGEGGYALTYTQGATTFELDGDNFIPVE